MKKIRIFGAVIALFGLGSCGESFFDLTPNYEVAVDDIYETAGDFDIAVVGCYAKFQTQVNYYTELCEYRSDNLYLDAPTTGTQDRYDIDQFRDNASNGILEDAWANFDNAVYRCNMVLDRIDGADFDERLKAQYKGEAMFLRAYTYFMKYRLWGCVPTTRRVVTVEEALRIGRSSEEEMFDLIAGDLQEIVDQAMLPESYDGADAGRATLGAARTLLGKVYLTFKRPQQAADVLKEVIGKYALLEDVADVFDVNNKMNGEVIFAIRFNKTVVDEGHGAWFSISNLTDNSGQSPVLKSLYGEDDARRALIEYQKVPDVQLYLMKKFFDTRDATTLQYGNDQRGELRRFVGIAGPRSAQCRTYAGRARSAEHYGSARSGCVPPRRLPRTPEGVPLRGTAVVRPRAHGLCQGGHGGRRPRHSGLSAALPDSQHGARTHQQYVAAVAESRLLMV